MQKILPWTNENSLQSFPLSASFLRDDFIVDANFVQFDNFSPVFVRLVVTNTNSTATILTDVGEMSIVVPASSTNQTFTLRTSSLRFLGSITFGPGAALMCSQYADQAFEVNIPFLPTVVKSIYSGGGVYSISGLTGAVTLAEADVTYTVNQQAVTLNCITKQPGTVTINPLLSINGVPAHNNAIFIHEGDLIKLTPSTGFVTLSADTSPTQSIQPTLKYESGTPAPDPEHPAPNITLIRRDDVIGGVPVRYWIGEVVLDAHTSIFVTPRSSSYAANTRETDKNTLLAFTQANNAIIGVNSGFYLPVSPETVGQPAVVIGFLASNGVVVSPFTTQPPENGVGGWTDQSYAILNNAPAIHFAQGTNLASVVTRGSDAFHIAQAVPIWNAVSGSFQTVRNGVNVVRDIHYEAAPANKETTLTNGNGWSEALKWYDDRRSRTAIAINQAGNKLWFVVVDQYPPGVSEGISIPNLVDSILLPLGAWNAINTDGGGSTALVWRDPATLNYSYVNANPAPRPTGANMAIGYIP